MSKVFDIKAYEKLPPRIKWNKVENPFYGYFEKYVHVFPELIDILDKIPRFSYYGKFVSDHKKIDATLIILSPSKITNNKYELYKDKVTNPVLQSFNTLSQAQQYCLISDLK